MKSVNILMMGDKQRALFGYTYNADAALDANMLPTNWGIPTKAQIDTLQTFLDYYTAGQKLKLANSLFWNLTTSGTNNYGFKLLGAGWIDKDGYPQATREIGSFWVYDTPASSHWAYGALDDENYFYQREIVVANYNEGHSIRAIYNGGGTPASTIQDYEGNIYDVIQIDSQYWIAQNWKCKFLNDGTALTRRSNTSEWAVASGKYFAPTDFNEYLV